MGTNGFREDELVSRRVKVNGEMQTRIFPVVGGRLRLAHEENQSLNLQTEMVNWDGQFAIFKCCAVTNKGQFMGYGTANSQRDAKLAESLVELAETRAIARALRFAGYGMEFTSAEEVSHVAVAELEKEQTTGKKPTPVFPEGNGNGKVESKGSSEAINPGGNGSKCGPGRATTAQVRALFALTRKANYRDEDIQSLINPFNATRFEELPREAASQLIGYLQTEAAA
ncbi:MAG: hypothetical protein HY912_06345 [Desulfomonile tiedjei]|uniref:Uncharacterized protein n=1 Tax=Desulfomonile tiedjei TaxID=2358 RepID=A0A9D6UZ57_9BACT|nr:hypothetical protein [Desulfomonile tiedjei]